MPELVSKLIKFPADWVERIDRQRGKTPFSDFVRRAVLEKIGEANLSGMPAWGRPKKTDASSRPGSRRVK